MFIVSRIGCQDLTWMFFFILAHKVCRLMSEFKLNFSVLELLKSIQNQN